MSKKVTSSVMDDHGIQQLSSGSHIRLRLEMYMGSRSPHEQVACIFEDKSCSVKEVVWVPSLLTSFREIIDNSLDEFSKAGIKDPTLRVKYNEQELAFEVSDNGRGIPIDYVPETQKNLCTMVLTETNTGRNFNDTERKDVIGMNGLGGSVVMMISTEAELEIHRAGRPYKTAKSNDDYDGMYKFNQKFTEGNILFPDLQIHEPSIRKVKTDKTGTTISFKLSKEVFKHHQLPTELIYSILKEIAAANPTYKIFLNDSRIQVKGGVEKGLFGVSKLMSLDVVDEGFNSTFYIVPNAVKDLPINFHMQGLVNNAPALEGGTHLDTFKKGFAIGLIKALEKESKRRKMKPNRSDVEEGLMIYNTTKMDAPFFASQTKTKLINETVIKPIEKALSDEFFAELIKKNKSWIDEVYQRCADRTNKKDADEDRKAAKKLVKGKVAKLRDATGKNRSECELFLTEGDCIDAETEVLVFRDGVYNDTLAKDLVAGDYVLTHNNRFRPITATSLKVKDTITFDTDYGEFTVTPEHRMYVYSNSVFKFVEAKDITEDDMFVRNQFINVDSLHEIENVIRIVDDVYDYEIQLPDGEKIQASGEHSFMVFDTEHNEFIQLETCELKPKIHFMVMK